MTKRNGNKGYFSPHCLCSPKLGHQFGHPQQIVGRPYKPGQHLRLLASLESSLPKSPSRFSPFKDLLHLLSKSLDQSIPHMPRRSASIRRASSALGILSHMRGNLPASQHAYKPSFVIPLIAPRVLILTRFRPCRLSIASAAPISAVPVAGVTCKKSCLCKWHPRKSLNQYLSRNPGAKILYWAGATTPCAWDRND
jgi:hypothetical protein